MVEYDKITAGDTLTIRANGAVKKTYTTKVIKTTKTMIIAENNFRYSKKTGILTGSSDMWWPNRIIAVQEKR